MTFSPSAHPHTSISLPTVQSLSVNPILFTQVPALDTVITKLTSFIDTTPSWPSSPQDQIQLKELLGRTIIPYLKARFPNTKQGQKAPASSASISSAVLDRWARSTETFTAALSVSELFPLVDMWRLAILDPSVGTFISQIPAGNDSRDPLLVFLDHGIAALKTSSPNPRNFILTLLRLLSNAFSCAPLARRVAEEWRALLTPFLIATLLHDDPTVRTSAASFAFNVAAFFQNRRVETVRKGLGVEDGPAEDGEWEVEMVSAVVEAIGREKESEDVGESVLECNSVLSLLLRSFP